MSRALTYNLTTFDGGITEKIRDLSDLSKCAHVSHFDIYRDSRVLYPMPGYISDEAIVVHTTSEGTSSPETVADDDAVGTVEWTNPTNAKTSNNVYATASVGAGTIIESSIKLVKADSVVGTSASTGATLPATDTTVEYGGSADLWGTTWTPAEINAATFGVAFSGSATDTTHYLKATGFGFSVPTDATVTGIEVAIEMKGASSTISIDHITMTVYYSVPADADGLTEHNIRAFFYDGTMRAVGYKEDGTGSKLFEKGAPTDAGWEATDNGEGADDLFLNTFLVRNGGTSWFATTSGTTTYLAKNDGTVTTDKAATLAGALLESTNDYLLSEQALDGNYYANTGNDDLIALGTSAVTDPICATIDTVTDLQQGDAQLAFVGYNTFPHTGVFSIWDLTANPNETLYRYALGMGIPRAVGKIGSQWGVVMDEGIGLGSQSQLAETTNGVYGMNVALVSGAEVRSHARIEAATNTNGKIVSSRGTHRDAMLFYARLAQDAVPSVYKEGIWAFGLNKRGMPALSLLLDTSSLGSIEKHYPVGYHHFFAHAGDGSVSRLDSLTGTYDETCVWESLCFGADSPYRKGLDGVTVATDPLPVGGSVVLKYRTTPYAGWATLGSSTEDGRTSHTFTRIDGVPIGSFPEIQFRLETIGSAGVRGFFVNLTELDDLAY
jgi:hypothetical protein